MAGFYDLLALDMQRLVNTEIVSSFARLEPAPLSAISIAELQAYEAANPHSRKGLYLLMHAGSEAYVGKPENSLAERLAEHRAKLSARQNMDVSQMAFKCIFLDKNWSALAHERPLIEALGCPWNNAGFGNHDPGRQRDRTRLKPTHFDRLFPITPASPVQLAPGAFLIQNVLPALRDHLPYLLRYETSTAVAAQYFGTTVTVGAAETAESLLGKVVDALGANWQVTFFCGYVILYPEPADYFPESFLKMKRGGSAWASPPPA